MAKHDSLINQVIELGLETDLEKQALQFLNQENMISLLEDRLQMEKDRLSNIKEEISALVASEDLDMVTRFINSLDSSPKRATCIDKLSRAKRKLESVINKL